MTRLVIAGVPRAGKTTLANRRVLELYPAHELRHTDDLSRGERLVSWSEASAIVSTQWFSAPGPWIVEGVAAVRALRKWCLAHPDVMQRPCDRVLWLDIPRVPLTPGQETMAKGCRTVWRQVRGELLARGVHVEEV